jgi:hypothetical protein
LTLPFPLGPRIFAMASATALSAFDEASQALSAATWASSTLR